MTTSTNRRQFLTGAAALSAAALVPGAYANSGIDNSEANAEQVTLPKLTHTVFFQLKNPESKEDRQQLIDGLKTLRAIETVRGLHIGVPASTEQRDVVNNDYQVSELLLFDDVEGQDSYQVHPIHEKFVEDCAHLWSNVVVYDSIAV